MTRAALALYQLVPTSDAEGADPPASIRLAAIALIHEKSGNIRGAFAAYEQLVLDYSAATNRENHLYQLVRTAAILGEHDSARLYARKFYQEYPKSAQLAELRAMGFDFINDNKAPAQEIESSSKAATHPVKAFPKSRKFAVALDLYQGRKYQDAKIAFSEIQTRCRAAVPPDSEGAALAAFYEAECLRKLGDEEGLAKALRGMGKHSSLGETREKQLELSALWSLVAIKNWEELERYSEKRIHARLPADQRAQVAYFYGLALQNQGRPFEALNAYNIAMTADAGASEESARQAALRVLEIHRADPEVQGAIKKWDVADENSEDPGLFRLREAAAVATLFEQSLGAGASLPAELREFLKYRGGL
jgi:TolA-binding protein